MSRRSCTNHPDNFCYVCGQYTNKDQQRSVSKAVKMKAAYFHYFGSKVGDQDKSWAPHICCRSCQSGLTQWLVGKRASIPFAVPMIWREPIMMIVISAAQASPASTGRIKATSSTLTASPLVILCLMMTRTLFQHLQLIRT